MKKLGQTENGDFIVEFSKEEMAEITEFLRIVDLLRNALAKADEALGLVDNANTDET